MTLQPIFLVVLPLCLKHLVCYDYPNLHLNINAWTLRTVNAGMAFRIDLLMTKLNRELENFTIEVTDDLKRYLILQIE